MVETPLFQNSRRRIPQIRRDGIHCKNCKGSSGTASGKGQGNHAASAAAGASPFAAHPTGCHAGSVPEPAPVAAEPSEDSLDRLELEAYRRAEAAERIAFQRAKKLYEALGNICTEARTQLESADSAARNSITAMELQLQTLKDSCDALTAALSGARQQLLDMDVMIPDPAEGLEEV